MAINSWTSLEEDKQKASQDSGVFNSILNTNIKDEKTYKEISSTLLNIIQNF